MSLAELITVASAGPSHAHTLTDGRFTCTYGDLPELLESIDRHLHNQGIGLAETLALECINTLPAALTLLSLLCKGRRFLLLPGTGEGETGRESKPPARFCKYRIAVRQASQDTSSVWLQAPEQFLHVGENERYCGRPNESGQHEGTLYLRTSGSMGAGKIVVHDQRRLLENAMNCLERFGLEATDRVTLPMPICHMYGLAAGFLPSLAAGSSIHLQEHSNILVFNEGEQAFRPNVAFLNPPFCEMLLRGCRSRKNYKLVVTSTQRIREDTFRAFDGRFGRLVSLYGSTEMGAVAACLPSSPLDERATAVGLPMAGVHLRMGEADGSDSVAEAGSELFCQHPYGFDGYLDDDGRWLRRAETSAWHRTGDVAQANAKGHLSILGRVGDSVNRSGYLVMFSEIEKTLEKMADVEHAVVVATASENQRGQRLTAFCALRHTAAQSAAQIRNASFELLPKYAIPDDVIVIENLPLLPSGKVDRQALLALAG